jgi:hypothetical protein
MFDPNDSSPLLPALSPQRQVQRVGDYWELREEFRKQALVSLRRREGLPTSEHLRGAFYQRADGFYRDPPGREVFLDTTLYPNGQGGFSQWSTGTRKGETREDAEKNWAAGRSAFEILDVAEDGRKLTEELLDLNRDAATYARAERVSHGAEGEQAPDLVLDGTTDEEVDARLQEYLKRGPR